jgi:hypothetical protein
MRTVNPMLFGLLFAIAATPACGTTGAEIDEEAVGSSEARLSLSVQGKQSATLHVTATDDATAEIAIDESIQVEAGSTALLALAIAPSSYTFQVEAFADAGETELLGSGSAHASLAAGQATEIDLTASVDGSTGSAAVQISTNAAPTIEGIDVAVGGGGSLGVDVGVGADATAEIHVKASDAEGHELRFFWSGLGIEGAVEGSSTITISAAAAAEASADASVHVIVQDEAGATTEATISFTAAGECLLCGGSEVQIVSTVDASASAKACLEAQAECNASCDADLAANPLGLAAHASCLASCSLSLASCCAE